MHRPPVPASSRSRRTNEFRPSTCSGAGQCSGCSGRTSTTGTVRRRDDGLDRAIVLPGVFGRRPVLYPAVLFVRNWFRNSTTARRPTGNEHPADIRPALGGAAGHRAGARLLIWHGDILTMYALVSFALLLFRDARRGGSSCGPRACSCSRARSSLVYGGSPASATWCRCPVGHGELDLRTRHVCADRASTSLRLCRLVGTVWPDDVLRGAGNVPRGRLGHSIGLRCAAVQ